MKTCKFCLSEQRKIDEAERSGNQSAAQVHRAILEAHQKKAHELMGIIWEDDSRWEVMEERKDKK